MHRRQTLSLVAATAVIFPLPQIATPKANTINTSVAQDRNAALTRHIDPATTPELREPVVNGMAYILYRYVSETGFGDAEPRGGEDQSNENFIMSSRSYNPPQLP